MNVFIFFFKAFNTQFVALKIIKLFKKKKKNRSHH